MTFFDPFGDAMPRLLTQSKEAPLRVNPKQARAFGPGSRRVDLRTDDRADHIIITMKIPLPDLNSATLELIYETRH